MDEVARSVKPIELHCRIPTLQWLRLQWLAEARGCDMDAAVTAAVCVGMAAMEVPATIDGLVDSSGHLLVTEGEAELLKRWEANYIYAEEDPAEEEET